MSPRKAPKVTYQQVAIDSGYFSDLVEASRRTDDAVAHFFSSSSCSHRGSFAMTAFDDDTEWDVPASSAKSAVLEKRCRDLAKQIKKPSRFPIRPLDCTLARAKAEKHAPRNSVGHIIDDRPAKTQQVKISAIIDSHGRTRAAAREIATAGTCGLDSSFGGSDHPSQHFTERKRGRDQDEETRMVKKSRIRRSSDRA